MAWKKSQKNVKLLEVFMKSLQFSKSRLKMNTHVIQEWTLLKSRAFEPNKSGWWGKSCSSSVYCFIRARAINHTHRTHISSFCKSPACSQLVSLASHTLELWFSPFLWGNRSDVPLWEMHRRPVWGLCQRCKCLTHLKCTLMRLAQSKPNSCAGFDFRPAAAFNG